MGGTTQITQPQGVQNTGNAAAGTGNGTGYLTADDPAATATTGATQATLTSNAATGEKRATTTTGNQYTVTGSGENVSINGTSSSGTTVVRQALNDKGVAIPGVYYQKDAEGNCQVIINKDAGDVNIDDSFLRRILGDNYDSNKVTVVLNQDNLSEGQSVGRVNVSTDVGKIIVDNDNDYTQVGGSSNVARADLSVSNQHDNLIVVQDVDVNTMGWSTRGNGSTQNIGAALNYNFDGGTNHTNFTLQGQVNNNFTTTTTGATGLMAGNEVNVHTTNVAQVTDTTSMNNNFQVGDKIQQTEIPQQVYDYLTQHGLNPENAIFKDAAQLGISNADVNHFAHGANGGDGLIVMKMQDGSWVVSGSGSPQTYHFTAAADSSGNVHSSTSTSDPFNRSNYSASNSADSGIQATTVNVEQLRQSATGSVYGIQNYTIRNSVNNTSVQTNQADGGNHNLNFQGSAQQSINVTGIDYSLSADSGNYTNGVKNTTTGTMNEVHQKHVTSVASNLNAQPTAVGLSAAMCKSMLTDPLAEIKDDVFKDGDLTTITNQITNSDAAKKAGVTGTDVLNKVATDLGKNVKDLTKKDIQGWMDKN